MQTAQQFYTELTLLNHQRKVIEAKYQKLKDETIKKFLIKRDEVVGDEGLILFTYKAREDKRVNVKKLEDEMPSIYEQYLVTKEIKIFLLK